MLIFAVLGGIMAFMAVFGIGELLKRTTGHNRFGAFRHDFQKEKVEKIKETKSVSIPPAMKILLILGGGFAFGCVVMIVTGKLSIAALSSLGGFIVPKLWLQHLERNQEKALASQLEQAVESMSMVIRSGGGISDALEKALDDAKEPLKKYLIQASSELKLGVPEMDVFQRLADRINVPEIDMLSVATALRKEGMAVNMANVLSQIQGNIRVRQAFEGEVKAITSENRMAVWIVAAVPFFTISLIRFFSPDFIAPLFNNIIGIVALLLTIILVVVGVIWALKIADTELI